MQSNEQPYERPPSPSSVLSNISWPNWVPLQPVVRRRAVPTRTDEEETHLLPPDIRRNASASASGVSRSLRVRPPDPPNTRRSGVRRLPMKDIIIPPNEDRIAKRELSGWQIFMISLNGTLGTGLYWGGGAILETGGPVAAVVSFLLIGILSWMVMQCITEMLCIWPVPGALSVYVSTFVDEELGIAVGFAYWFTYSVSFSALLTSTASEIGFWNPAAWVQGVIFFFMLPIVLIAINWFGIKIYGRFETVVGVMKIIFYTVMVIIMMAIAAGAGPGAAPKGTSWATFSSRTQYDTQASDTWTSAFITCLSQASFAYVGVEITAASALEAGWRDTKSNDDNEVQPKRNKMPEALVSNTIRSASMYFPVATTFFYTTGILLVSLAVPSDHCDLPRMDWVHHFNCTTDNGTHIIQANQNATSAFTIAARMSGISGLDDVMNTFQVFTAFFCASTNLYVASRTIFSLTCNIDGGHDQTWFLRWLAKLGKTNHRKVPLRAVVFSALAFSWVPLLQLIRSSSFSKSYGGFTEVLAGMGSVGVLIVWFCNVWAYIRFNHFTRKFRETDELKKYMEAQRDDKERYPFRAHQQPQIAWLALIVIFFLLAVANGAPIWTGFQSVPFLTAYLTIVCFVALYVTLKFVRNGQWELVDLSKAELVAKKIQRLNDTRYRALERGVRSTKPAFRLIDFLKSCRDMIQDLFSSRGRYDTI